ncbi:MAG TPA: hypothetical protein VFT81_07570 [Dermatophilaceae bacterium]|nr:hypothetical protein [Dermatophilaceae bacterium]
MLETLHYDQDYVDECRARSEAQVAAFEDVRSRADIDGTDPVGSLEPDFFNNMLLVLDAYFVHRPDNVAGRVGGPLTEVRVLASSLMLNGGTMRADKPNGLGPGRSLLGYAEGDDIHLTQEQYVTISRAFFDEVERTYVPR